MSNGLKGLLYMLGSTLSFALMSAAVKAIPEVPLGEKVFTRNLISLLFAFLVIKKTKASLFGKRENQLFLLSRSLFGLCGVCCIFYAITHLSLADSAIFMRLSPIYVTIFAWLFLKDKIAKWQYLSLFFGFAGSLCIIKPELSLDIVPTLFGMAAPICAGAAYTLVSFLRDKEEPATIVFYFSCISVIFMIPLLFITPHIPSQRELIFLLLTGATAAIGQIFLTHAYRLQKASEVSIYFYTGIVFSAVLGYLFWDEIPDTATSIGALSIFVSGLLTYTHREKK